MDGADMFISWQSLKNTESQLYIIKQYICQKLRHFLYILKEDIKCKQCCEIYI